MTTVAALYVQAGGAYSGLDDVDPWDAWRDRFGGRRGAWVPSGHRGGTKGLTSVTPPDFRDVLLAMARSARP